MTADLVFAGPAAGAADAGAHGRLAKARTGPRAAPLAGGGASDDAAVLSGGLGLTRGTRRGAARCTDSDRAQP